MKNTLFILLICWLIMACDKNTESSSDIKQIRYGTSFGECMGYCKKEILLKLGSVTYTRSGWVDSVITITCSETLADANWNSFKTGIDTKSFFAMAETIGCPDCADGGAEWIEIEKVSGEKHKVTFEYMHEPEALKSYVAGLREQSGKVGECGK